MLDDVRDARTALAMLRDFDPQRLTTEVARLGEEWAERDAAAASLEESRKSVLASLTLEYVDAGTSGRAGEKPRALPVTQAEARALSDARYEQHLELMVLARKEAHIARVRYDMGKMKLELMRSLQATMRQEMQMARNG
jgi:hypothetical protein